MVNVLPPQVPSPTPLRLVPWTEIDLSFPVDHHIHTNYTDGNASIAQMTKAAVSKGMTTVLFSEHVRHTSTYFPSFADEIRTTYIDEMKQYVGVEAKILSLDGSLDCSPQIALLCDAIIGSVHSFPSDTNDNLRNWSQLRPEVAVKLEFQLANAVNRLFGKYLP